MTVSGISPEHVKGCNRAIFPCIIHHLAYIVLWSRALNRPRQSSKSSYSGLTTTLSCSLLRSLLRIRTRNNIQPGAKTRVAGLQVTSFTYQGD